MAATTAPPQPITIDTWQRLLPACPDGAVKRLQRAIPVADTVRANLDAELVVLADVAAGHHAEARRAALAGDRAALEGALQRIADTAAAIEQTTRRRDAAQRLAVELRVETSNAEYYPEPGYAAWRSQRENLAWRVGRIRQLRDEHGDPAITAAMQHQAFAGLVASLGR